MTLIDEIARQHSQTARMIYERHGRLLPKIWAQSIDRMLVAEPLDREAIDEMTDEFRATLAIAMACRIDALAVGRSDEAYIRTIDEDSLDAGDLAEVVDIDPRVRTCLVTEAVAIGGSEEVTIIATHGLDDYGRHVWAVEENRAGIMRSLVPLQVARNMIADGLPDFWRDPIALEQFAQQIRWAIQVFPEPVR
jgi:hypothetical protein